MYEDFTIDSVENLNRESDRIQEEVERRVGSGLRGTKRRRALDLDFTLPIDQIEPDVSEAKKKDTAEKSDSPQNIAFSEESPLEPIFSEALPPEVIPEETLSSGRPIIEETDVESITEASDDRPEIAESAEPPAGSGSGGEDGSSENGDKVKADQNKIDHLFQTEDEPPRKSFFGFKKKRGGNNKSF